MKTVGLTKAIETPKPQDDGKTQSRKPKNNSGNAGGTNLQKSQDDGTQGGENPADNPQK